MGHLSVQNDLLRSHVFAQEIYARLCSCKPLFGLPIHAGQFIQSFHERRNESACPRLLGFQRFTMAC